MIPMKFTKDAVQKLLHRYDFLNPAQYPLSRVAESLESVVYVREFPTVGPYTIFQGNGDPVISGISLHGILNRVPISVDLNNYL